MLFNSVDVNYVGKLNTNKVKVQCKNILFGCRIGEYR
tara:strand:- start:255 stop:365 length:111 start_codon:yes stop_codon:yes gene_type:complete